MKDKCIESTNRLPTAINCYKPFGKTENLKPTGKYIEHNHFGIFHEWHAKWIVVEASVMICDQGTYRPPVINQP